MKLNMTALTSVSFAVIICAALAYQNCSKGSDAALSVGSAAASPTPDASPSASATPAAMSPDSALLFALDAADGNSYTSGGQVWNNLVTPADGSPSSYYSFILGLVGTPETYDPVFNGTVGSMNANTYFSLNGNQFFTMHGGTNDYTRSWHHAGAHFTIEVWFRTPAAFATCCNALIGNTREGGGTDAGVQLLFTSAGHAQLAVLNGTATPALGVTSAGSLAVNTIYQLGVVVQDGGQGFFYLNGNYLQVAAADTFNSAFTAPSTGGPTGFMQLGDRGDDRRGVSSMPNGTRIYAARLYNRALTKAELDYRWNALRGRFGL